MRLTLSIVAALLLLLSISCSNDGERLQFVEFVASPGGNGQATDLQLADTRTSQVNVAGQVSSALGLCILPFADLSTIDDSGFGTTFIPQTFENYLTDYNGVRSTFIRKPEYDQLRSNLGQSGYVPEGELLSYLQENLRSDYVLYGKIDTLNERVYFLPTIVDVRTGLEVEAVEPFYFLSPGEKISWEVMDQLEQYVGEVINLILEARGI